MSKITIRDIEIPQVCESEIVEQQHRLSFVQFVQASGQDEQWIYELLAHDILTHSPAQPQQHYFIGEDVVRARRAHRLQRDFDASFRAVAVMLDLIDEVKALRKRIRD